MKEIRKMILGLLIALVCIYLNFIVADADPVWPCESAFNVSTLYYYNTYNNGGPHSTTYDYHNGLDINGGGNILACESGTVITVKYLTTSYGHHVKIQHANGAISIYGHMSDIYVSEGQNVSRGQVIGVMGSTGNSTGTHLHFEYSDNDPMQTYFVHSTPQITFDSSVYSANSRHSGSDGASAWFINFVDSYCFWDGSKYVYYGDSPCNCSETYAGTYICITSTYPLNVRPNHNGTGDPIGQIPIGAEVYVSKANEAWAHVDYGGVSGYASMEYLQLKSNEESVVSDPDVGQEMTTGYDREIPDGYYLIVSAGSEDKRTHYYLDINGADCPAGSGTNVSLQGLQGEPADFDIWHLTYSDGFYSITQKGSGGTIALDLYWASLKNRANVVAHTANGSSAQKWAISRNRRDGYRIQAKCSGLSLDVADGKFTSGTNIQQHIGNDSLAQSWLFIPYQPSQSLTEGKYVLLSEVDNRFELDVPGDTGDVADKTELWIWDDGAKSKYNAFDITKLNNGYYKVIHSASGKALEVYGGGSDPNKRRISLMDWNGSLAQQWAITKDGANGGYVLRVRSSGYAIDLENALTENQAPVRQHYYNGTAAETWKFVPAEYTVNYDANGGIGVPENQIKYYKENLRLSSTQPFRTGYEFQGWAKTKTASVVQFMPGGIYSTDENITLYAVWKVVNPDLVLPEALTTIEEEAFEGGVFTYVKLGENVMTISSRAFANCPNLRHIYMPGTITKIAADAFSGVDKSMTVHGTEGSYVEYYANNYGFQFVND